MNFHFFLIIVFCFRLGWCGGRIVPLPRCSMDVPKLPKPEVFSATSAAFLVNWTGLASRIQTERPLSLVGWSSSARIARRSWRKIKLNWQTNLIFRYFVYNRFKKILRQKINHDFELGTSRTNAMALSGILTVAWPWPASVASTTVVFASACIGCMIASSDEKPFLWRLFSTAVSIRRSVLEDKIENIILKKIFKFENKSFWNIFQFCFSSFVKKINLVLHQVIPSFYLWTHMFERRQDSLIERLQNDWWAASTASTAYWFPVQMTCFSLIPSVHRVAYVSFASFVHKSVLSWWAHRCPGAEDELLREASEPITVPPKLPTKKIDEFQGKAAVSNLVPALLVVEKDEELQKAEAFHRDQVEETTPQENFRALRDAKFYKNPYYNPPKSCTAVLIFQEIRTLILY